MMAVRMPDAGDQFGSRTAARWIGTIMAVALLWCDGALAAEPRVLLLRGWLNLFSAGLDRLADELRARGIKAEVRRHLYWTTAVSDILRDRAAGNVGPVGRPGTPRSVAGVARRTYRRCATGVYRC